MHFLRETIANEGTYDHPVGSFVEHSVPLCAFEFQFHFTWLSVTHPTFSKKCPFKREREMQTH